MTQTCPTFSILDLDDNTKFNGPPMAHDRGNFSVVSTKYRIYAFGGRSNANLIGYCEMFDIRNARYVGSKLHLFNLWKYLLPTNG